MTRKNVSIKLNKLTLKFQIKNHTSFTKWQPWYALSFCYQSAIWRTIIITIVTIIYYQLLNNRTTTIKLIKKRNVQYHSRDPYCTSILRLYCSGFEKKRPCTSTSKDASTWWSKCPRGSQTFFKIRFSKCKVSKDVENTCILEIS